MSTLGFRDEVSHGNGRLWYNKDDAVVSHDGMKPLCKASVEIGRDAAVVVGDATFSVTGWPRILRPCSTKVPSISELLGLIIVTIGVLSLGYVGVVVTIVLLHPDGVEFESDNIEDAGHWKRCQQWHSRLTDECVLTSSTKECVRAAVAAGW